jgi:hypothetical protein
LNFDEVIDLDLIYEVPYAEIALLVMLMPDLPESDFSEEGDSEPDSPEPVMPSAIEKVEFFASQFDQVFISEKDSSSVSGESEESLGLGLI